MLNCELGKKTCLEQGNVCKLIFLLKIREKTGKTEKYLLQLKKGGTVIKLGTYFGLAMEKVVLFSPLFSEGHPLSEETMVAAHLL